MDPSGHHHLHMRRRREGRRPLSFSKRFFDHVMLVVGFISPLALIPQVWSIFATGTTEGLSLFTFAVLAMFNSLWALYGYMHRAYPVMISSALFAALQTIIVCAIVILS